MPKSKDTCPVHTIGELLSHEPQAQVTGNENVTFTRAASILENCTDAMTWLRSNLANCQKVLKESKSSVVFCDHKLDVPSGLTERTCFLAVENPKLSFLKAVARLFPKHRLKGIHATAVVSPDANLGTNVAIGPYAVIEADTVVGNDCIIGAYTMVHSGVTLGDRVHLHEHVNVGSDGFGFVRDEEGILVKFEHIGGVLIGDDVEIYPFSNVDRGTLGNTTIGRGSKLDHYVHAGHNTKVGEDTILTAGTVLCGGAQVGAKCWTAVGSIVREKVIVGNEVTIGMNSVVTKNVPDGSTWLGSPAEDIHDFVGKRKLVATLHQEGRRPNGHGSES